MKFIMNFYELINKIDNKNFLSFCTSNLNLKKIYLKLKLHYKVKIIKNTMIDSIKV